MKLIKLNAIDSTNSFLKELASNSSLENFTVVTANKQLKGRGQQNKNWESEPYKNLTVSVFINKFNLKINQQKYLNFAISLAIYNVLIEIGVPHLSIKWPNDILSLNKKICGILIENTFKGDTIKNSIIGIGINVNQEKFSNSLQNATSLKNLLNKELNLDSLLEKIIQKIKDNLSILSLKEYQQLEVNYLKVLYKKNIATMFKDSNNVLFMGIIRGLSSKGNLIIELEDETLKEFGIKEVSLA